MFVQKECRTYTQNLVHERNNNIKSEAVTPSKSVD